MRLWDRLARRAGYWEGLASGAAVLTTSYGSSDREQVLPELAAFSQQSYGPSSIWFAAILVRVALFSEARFKYQAKDDKHLFGNEPLLKLEDPYVPHTRTGELLVRMEQAASLAGQCYIWDPPGEDRLVRLRPDWVTIISEVVPVADDAWYRRKIGYWHEPPKNVLDQGQGFFVPAEECVHWVPVPDPQADFRGMSWLTPAYREIMADSGMTQYKIRYLQNDASPNVIIRYAQKLHPGTVDSVRDRMTARYAGPENAGKTLVLDQGADLTIVGSNLQQMDFANVSAVGVERILADGNVPGVLVGLEPLRGAGRAQRSRDLRRPEWQTPRRPTGTSRTATRAISTPTATRPASQASPASSATPCRQTRSWPPGRTSTRRRTRASTPLSSSRRSGDGSRRP